MSETSRSAIAAVIAFHGHFCPGLATGIRLCDAARDALGLSAGAGDRAGDEELVAVIETANCAADAIQFLLGCTYGKANLIHLDYGRNVYTILRRDDGRAVRLTCLPLDDPMTAEQQALLARIRGGAATAADREAYDALWVARGEAVLARPLETLFAVEMLPDYAPPPRARIEPSVACDHCGALVMASRLCEVDGRRLCAVCAPQPEPALAVTAIGVVRNALGPGSPPRAQSPRSRLEIAPAYRAGLDGLDAGSELDVLFYFDRATGDPPLRQHRRGDRDEPLRGVFTLRSPARPTPVGLTRVTVLEVAPDALVVAGLDAWDGSPLIDIKPAMR